MIATQFLVLIGALPYVVIVFLLFCFVWLLLLLFFFVHVNFILAFKQKDVPPFKSDTKARHSVVDVSINWAH